MINFNDKPFLEYLIYFCYKNNLDPIVLAVGHLSSVIKKYFNNHKFIVPIKIVDSEIKGTGFSFLSALDSLSTSEVLVMNGDTIVDFNISELINTHKSHNSHCTVVLSTLRNVPNEGAFIIGSNQKILYSKERRNPIANIWFDNINWKGSSTGVILFQRSILTNLEKEKFLSLEKDIVPYFIDNHNAIAFNNGNKFFMDFGELNRLELLKDKYNYIINKIYS